VTGCSSRTQAEYRLGTVPVRGLDIRPADIQSA
jgi:hypothetical protein